MRKAHPDAIYAIAGDGDAREELQALAASEGVGEYVRFLGHVSDADVLALYRSSDLFVMPSMKEGFGIVFVEAAATGIPVLGGSRDGSVDALAEGRIGRMIDPLDEGALVAALIDELNHRRPADPAAVQRFSFENFAQHVDAIVGSFAE